MIRWEEDAESRCEALITEALMVAPSSPECFQTLASVRISQLRPDDARVALSRGLELWKDLPPEDYRVPDFSVRVSLSRLLMEVQMEIDAIEVLERLILEDDESVEAWYLGGWCLYLLAEKGKEQSTFTGPEFSPTEKRHASLVASREWLKQSLKLYEKFQYEDERLRDHAVELVQDLNKGLGEDVNDDSNVEDEGDTTGNDDEWEDEIEGGSDKDEDHEMEDS